MTVKIALVGLRGSAVREIVRTHDHALVQAVLCAVLVHALPELAAILIKGSRRDNE